MAFISLLPLSLAFAAAAAAPVHVSVFAHTW